MSLAHGGHLTHGMHLNFSGKLYNVVHYGVRKDDERIDYDEVAKLTQEHKPKLIVAGASAYPREIDFVRFAEIARENEALFMVDMAHIAGLVAGEQHSSPVPWADFVTTTTHKTLRGPRAGLILCKEEWKKAVNQNVFPGMQGGPLMHVIAGKAICLREAQQPEFRSYAAQIIANARALAHVFLSRDFRLVSGGTDNHLLLVDVNARGLSGKVAEIALDAAGITVNRNGIPFDQRKPLDPSGIRIGTPALTTRGMKEREMQQIGAWICDVLDDVENEKLQQSLREQVRELCQDFPAPASTN